MYSKNTVRVFLFVFLGNVLLQGGVYTAHAQESQLLSVTPVVIDEKTKTRDILKKSVTIRNVGTRKLNVYPAVHDVHPENGDQAFVPAEGADERSTSLANWIELSRGVIDISPGEERNIPFVIRVHHNAQPGTYHAAITFSEGDGRDGARKVGSLMVNIEVQAEVKEILQLNKFFTDNVFFAGDDVVFNYQVENIGNQELLPKGEIRIYNRKGEEVASVEVNADGKPIAPDQLSQLASVWSAANGFGKFKAFLNVDYGKSQPASVQDTVFFWIIPWKQLLGLFVASVIVVVFFALYSHRFFERRFAGAHTGALAHMPSLTPAMPAAPTAVETSPLQSSVEKKPGVVRRTLAVMTGAARATVSFVPRPVRPLPTIPSTHEDMPPAGTRAPQKTLREVFAEAPARTPAQTGTIDLKTMCGPKKAPEAPAHGHVIDLKRRG